ncbi:hypothetical protein V2I01_36600 [Micromonospora sp. BRA006-A]|nr:hypothetical protein [Micromonospora sp. BRA006-A]
MNLRSPAGEVLPAGPPPGRTLPPAEPPAATCLTAWPRRLVARQRAPVRQTVPGVIAESPGRPSGPPTVGAGGGPAEGGGRGGANGCEGGCARPGRGRTSAGSPPSRSSSTWSSSSRSPGSWR